MEQPVPIIIVDDDVQLCETLSRLFEKDGRVKVLAISHSPHDVIRLLRKYKPYVLLLDLEFEKENISGVDVLKALRKHDDIDVKVLVYTIYATDEEIFDALRAGANSYVWKHEDTDTIIDAVVDTDANKAYISLTIAQRLLDHFEKYQELFDGDALTATQRSI